MNPILRRIQRELLRITHDGLGLVYQFYNKMFYRIRFITKRILFSALCVRILVESFQLYDFLLSTCLIIYENVSGDDLSSVMQ